MICNYSNTTGATSGAGIAYPSGAHEFIPVFSGVRVTRSLLFCVIFCRSLFVPCPLSWVVCPSIYGFWLPLWHLQTFLIFFPIGILPSSALAAKLDKFYDP